jgi:IS30 family transposase
MPHYRPITRALKRYTLDERKTIQRMIEEGRLQKEIGFALGRTKSSISCEIQRAKGLPYDARAIHKECMDNRNQKIGYVGGHNQWTGPVTMRILWNEIENIKQQLEILFDLLGYKGSNGKKKTTTTFSSHKL